MTSGYSLLFTGGGADNEINVGGGMNWWFKDRVGLRLELRDHSIPNSQSFHIVSFRIGLSFR